jgi:hypothetical protein
MIEPQVKLANYAKAAGAGQLPEGQCPMGRTVTALFIPVRRFADGLIFSPGLSFRPSDETPILVWVPARILISDNVIGRELLSGLHPLRRGIRLRLETDEAVKAAAAPSNPTDFPGPMPAQTDTFRRCNCEDTD